MVRGLEVGVPDRYAVSMALQTVFAQVITARLISFFVKKSAKKITW